MLPSVLIENKIDLVEEEELKDDIELKEFAEKNKFNGYFRSSAKLGININESMEFLIKTIIKRMEDNSTNDRVSQDVVKSIILKNSKTIEQKKNPTCC
jgi:translation initiation factor 2 gamma subunit (eIF-2gamma)